MTRVIFYGAAPEKQKKVYKTVLEAQQASINFLKTSILNSKVFINATDVDKVARDHILSKGYPTIPHSVGHGIGLEVHEAPHLTTISKEIMKEGMVFSIEPGIYLPGEFGVRIEDLFTISNGKLIQLTNATKELVEI